MTPTSCCSRNVVVAERDVLGGSTADRVVGHGDRPLAIAVKIDGLDIAKGKHVLKIKCVGKSEKSSGTLFGMDYLKVVE